MVGVGRKVGRSSDGDKGGSFGSVRLVFPVYSGGENSFEWPVKGGKQVRWGRIRSGGRYWSTWIANRMRLSD